MNFLETIQNWNKKPKELVVFLTASIIKDKKLFAQLVEILKTGSDVLKGTCADVMKCVSTEKPEIVAPYIDVLIKHINYKAPRVKWGVSEAIGNTAKKFPKETAKAIPYLLINTKDPSTVVRWCAAYALSEIAKHNTAVRKNLVPKIEAITKKEKNNGVKNVYSKTLKIINK